MCSRIFCSPPGNKETNSPPCPWDTHYQFLIKTLLSKKGKIAPQVVLECPALVCAWLCCACACAFAHVLSLHLVFPSIAGTTIRGGLHLSIMGSRCRHLRLARGSVYSDWLRSHRYPLHAPPRPHTYPSTHTTPLHATALHHTLTPSTRHVSKICKIVSPKYSSQRGDYITEGILWWKSSLDDGVRIPNRGALPIIASVSLTHLPCLFACFHEFVSCMCFIFSTCRSTCVARAACFLFCSILKTTFLLVIRMTLLICMSSFSICMSIIPNTCACVYKQSYAFPSSSILVHILSRFHMYWWCYALYLHPCFLCAFFFVRNLIDTCVTVSIDVIINLLIY